MESGGNLGNLLAYGAALALIGVVAVTAVRRMRVLALIAGLLGLAYVVKTGGSLPAYVLAGVFVLVNLVQLIGMWNRSKNGAMLSEERALFNHLLGPAAARHKGRLRDLMEWRMVSPGTVLMSEGEADPPLVYVASGRVAVEAAGVEVGTCGEGDFLGEMSLVSGHRASATVRVLEQARIARFDRDALAQYARAVPEVGTAFTNALNRGLAAKVERMNEAATRKGE